MPEVLTQNETHHMVDDDQPIEQAISRFISAFPYTRYHRFPECVRYDILHLAFAEAKEREAKRLIAEYKLPLETKLIKSAVDATLIIKAKHDKE